jgi:prophage antirepressor-like protein
MNELQIFHNEQFGQVRTIEENGKILFCGKDVAEALGYALPRKAISDHCKGVLKRNTPTNGGIQEMSFITESDLYRLIANSDMPSAQKFESWVFDEVLPTIRKTGGYVANEDLFIKTYLPYADNNIKSLFKMTLKVINQQNQRIEADKPKVEYFDALVDRNLLTNFRDTAKELQIKEKDFISFLTGRYIFRNQKGELRPYSEYVKSGLFEMKEYCSKINDRTGVQTLITPKGRETFRLLWRRV